MATKKQILKHSERACRFCPPEEQNPYAVLDVHRIVPGSEGGKYTDGNTVVVCCKCHRLIHAGAIEILGRHFSTSGRYVIHYLKEGQEHWA